MTYEKNNKTKPIKNIEPNSTKKSI